MRNIYIIDDNGNYTMHWLMGLLWAEKEFKEKGYTISFHNGTTLISRRLAKKQFLLCDLERICESPKEYDIILLAFHWVRKFFDSPDDEIIRVLVKLKKKCSMLVWLDTADSTGTPKFQFLPYVDFYLKKQLLKERTRYFGPIWGGKVHVEYYHNLLGIDDPEVHKNESFSPIINEEDLQKVGISWNVGAGNFAKGNIMTQIFHPHDYTKSYTFINPDNKKYYDIHFRGSAWSPLAGYQRREVIERLKNANDLSCPDTTKRVPIKEYNKELMNSRTVCSPFGWGEICRRDFETFIYGGALIKPDMSHIDTFPQWYIPEETYLPIRWDFSNFDELIENLKDSNKDEYFKFIAHKGQDTFKSMMTTKHGKEAFVNHLLKQLHLDV